MEAQPTINRVVINYVLFFDIGSRYLAYVHFGGVKSIPTDSNNA